MTTFDVNALKTDPGVIALGGDSAAIQEARGDPNPSGPACQAALAQFRTALTFKTIFTSVMAILAVVALGAIVFVLVRALGDPQWDATSALAVVTAAVTSAGAAFLGRQRKKAQAVLNDAMDDVGTYCGTGVQQQLQ